MLLNVYPDSFLDQLVIQKQLANKLVSIVRFGMILLQDPVLQTLTPQKGPCAGGTHVTLRGEHLNYGSSVSVKLFDKSAPVLW